MQLSTLVLPPSPGPAKTVATTGRTVIAGPYSQRHGRAPDDARPPQQPHLGMIPDIVHRGQTARRQRGLTGGYGTLPSMDVGGKCRTGGKRKEGS